MPHVISSRSVTDDISQSVSKSKLVYNSLHLLIINPQEFSLVHNFPKC